LVVVSPVGRCPLVVGRSVVRRRRPVVGWLVGLNFNPSKSDDAEHKS